mgnify:CR=1 FL=1
MAWLFVFAAFGWIVLAICVVAGRERRARFREKFPPISDAEFVARCSPGTHPEVALKVRRIVADKLGVEYDRVYPSSSFVDDLGAD